MSKTGQMNHALQVLISLTYNRAYRASDVYCIQLLEFGKTSVIPSASHINIVEFSMGSRKHSLTLELFASYQQTKATKKFHPAIF